MQWFVKGCSSNQTFFSVVRLELFFKKKVRLELANGSIDGKYSSEFSNESFHPWPISLLVCSASFSFPF
jgi:hypothetical protein